MEQPNIKRPGDYARHIRMVNAVMFQETASAQGMAVAVFHLLWAITSRGDRPYWGSNKKMLIELGLDPDDPKFQSALKKALALLRKQGVIQTYSRGAGRGNGVHRIIVLTQTWGLEGGEIEPTFTRRVVKHLDDMTWKEIQDLLYDADTGFHENWRERLDCLDW